MTCHQYTALHKYNIENKKKLKLLNESSKKYLKRIMEINHLIRIPKHVIMNLQLLCHKWKIGLIFLFY